MTPHTLFVAALRQAQRSHPEASVLVLTGEVSPAIPHAPRPSLRLAHGLVEQLRLLIAPSFTEDDLAAATAALGTCLQPFAPSPRAVETLLCLGETTLHTLALHEMTLCIHPSGEAHATQHGIPIISHGGQGPWLVQTPEGEIDRPHLWDALFVARVFAAPEITPRKETPLAPLLPPHS